jgi:preprotein translocase subunit SecG
METLLLVVHVLFGVGVIGLVLLQHGKGADMGAAFGSGSAGSLFGASGSANFLSRTTGVLAALFFITSMALTYIGSTRTEGKSVIERPKESQEVPKPTSSTTVPAPSSTVPIPSAPSESGSKAGDVPK